MCNTRKATVNFCYMSFSFPRCYSLCRCPVLAGKRHGAVSLLQEEKEAQTSRAHDRQPGSLWFWLQSLGSPVFHHFQVQNTFLKKKKNCYQPISSRAWIGGLSLTLTSVTSAAICQGQKLMIHLAFSLSLSLSLSVCVMPGCSGRSGASGTASRALCAASALCSPPVSSLWTAAWRSAA